MFTVTKIEKPERRKIDLSELAQKEGIMLDCDEIWYGEERRESGSRTAEKAKKDKEKKVGGVKLALPADFFG